MIRPTVDTLRRRPLRASMAWMRALPMNGYLRRTSITALTSLGFQARYRTRRGRVDFGTRPPIQRAPADPELLQRAALVAARRPKPVVRLERPVPPRGHRRHVFVHLEAAYDLIRMDSMFMGRVSFPSGFAFTGGYPIRCRGGIRQPRRRSNRQRRFRAKCV